MRSSLLVSDYSRLPAELTTSLLHRRVRRVCRFAGDLFHCVSAFVRGEYAARAAPQVTFVAVIPLTWLGSKRQS
jgi:hypothetical protein